MFSGQVVLELSFDKPTLGIIHSESGPHEALEFLCAALACGLALKCLYDYRNESLLRLWFGLASIGTLYIAGEEISWGQHIFGWITPDFWSGVNDQDETNLHNTSAWLDQKPRLLLFVSIVIAGLIGPALRRWKKPTFDKLVPERYRFLFPSAYLVPAALGVLLPYMAQLIAHRAFNTSLFVRVSEVQELYMYYFLLLYMLDFKVRKKSKQNALKN